MSEDRSYEPIDCSLHDRLEAAAVMHKPVRIEYRTSENELNHLDDRIVDVFARDGVEFLKVGNGTEIRLDDIASVDGVAFPAQ